MDWGRAVHYQMGHTHASTLVAHYHMSQILPDGSHSSTYIGRTHYYHLGCTLPRGWHTHYHLGSHTSTLVAHYQMGHTLSPWVARTICQASKPPLWVSHLTPNYLGADKLQKYNCTVSQPNMSFLLLLLS